MKSLRSNIYFAFAAIVTLLIAIGLIGYYGVSQLYQSSNAIRSSSDLTRVVQEIDRDVQVLQLRVSRYMATGHDSLIRDIVELNQQLASRIKQQADSQSNSEMQDLFVRMSEHLPAYKTHFDSVVEERGLRTDLVQNQLPKQSDVIHQHLRELNSNLPDSVEFVPEHAAVLSCENEFSQAEKLLLRYYIVADASFYKNAMERIKDAIVSLRKLETTAEAEQLRTSLIKELQEYERIGIRAVQATRSYLFLVNVVMAGEASEVTYFSNRLGVLAQAESRRSSELMSQTVGDVQSITKWGILLAVALGMLLAGRLGASILKPVTAITETFRQLAQGQTDVGIPETQRSDEIGQLAVAAEVFRRRNLEQEALLKSSELLRVELAAKAEELQVSNSDLDNFAYVASHDLKSPLRGIRQLAVWIEDDAGHLLPDESVQHFRKMQERVMRMELLLNDLLDYARIDRAKTKAENVDVGALAKNIELMIDNPQGVQIRVPIPLPTMKTYRVPLEQILLNLVGNAVKHNDKQTDGFVEIICEQGEQQNIFSISDNGPGISPKHFERVFQMYQRVGDPTVEGSGMGLAIVKKQVERNGGSIKIEKNPGNGVTFKLAWPNAQGDTNQ